MFAADTHKKPKPVEISKKETEKDPKLVVKKKQKEAVEIKSWGEI